MIGAAGETVLPRRAVPQPHPHVVKNGDCGACVLGGALGLPVEEVYDRLKSGRECINRGEMARMLRVACHEGIADRMIEAPAEWPSYQHFGQPFGRLAYLQSLDWFNYVRMAIDAGYYGLAEVNLSYSVPHETDHWVLICGARTEGGVVGKKLTGEVLVSCSARNPSGEWVEAREFLKERGGFNLLFVRPADFAVRHQGIRPTDGRIGG